MRRACPSSSISASAVRNWSAEAMSTERPRRFRAAEAIADPCRRAPSEIRWSAPTKYPAGGVPTSIASRSLGKRWHGVFIEADKLTQIHREGSEFARAERVHAQFGFQATYNNGETQRVQARVHQRQVIGQGRELLCLLLRDLLELVVNH